MSKVVESGSDTRLLGELPSRSDELISNDVVGDQKRYTCNYGFQQRFNENADWPGLEDSGPFLDAQTVDPSNAPYYLTEGSNSIGPVKVTTTTTPPPSDLQDLNQAIRNTNYPPHDQIFQHFPDEPTQATDPAARNPLIICQESYGC